MKALKHNYRHDNENMSEQRGGRWVPATPLPLYGLVFKRCGCGRRFLTQRGYEEHHHGAACSEAMRYMVQPFPWLQLWVAAYEGSVGDGKAREFLHWVQRQPMGGA